MWLAKEKGVHINYYSRNKIKDRLDKYCYEIGQTVKMAIERILDDHFAKLLDSKIESI